MSDHAPAPVATPVRRRAVLAGLGLAGAAGIAAVAVPRLRRPAAGEELILATGPVGAVFLEVGRDLARAVAAIDAGFRLQPRVTAATVDNLRLLDAAQVDLGFASLDAAAVDQRVSSRGIRAVGRLYDSVLHLVVPADSPITRLAQCTGRRVGIGAAGSGTEFTARRLLDLAGVRPAALVRLGQTPAMQAIADGSLDAAFSLTGFPTPAVADLAQRRAIRLVDLAAAVAVLDRWLPRVYGVASVPEGTYRGVPVTGTVFLPNLLLTRPALPDAAVAVVTAALFSPSSRRFWTNPDSRRIDVRSAIATGPVPLHPAALGWLRDHKP